MRFPTQRALTGMAFRPAGAPFTGCLPSLAIRFALIILRKSETRVVPSLGRHNQKRGPVLHGSPLAKLTRRTLWVAAFAKNAGFLPAPRTLRECGYSLIHSAGPLSTNIAMVGSRVCLLDDGRRQRRGFKGIWTPL